MILHAVAGLALGLGLFAWCARQVDRAALRAASHARWNLMRQALTHTGSFSALLLLQREILRLSLRHLRLLAKPALLSALPLVGLLVLWPELATVPFFLGMLCAYGIAKWRWGL